MRTHRQNEHWALRSRSGAVDWRVIAAGAVALAGVSAAAWSFIDRTEPFKERVEKPRVVRADGTTGTTASESESEQSPENAARAARATALMDEMNAVFDSPRSFAPVKRDEDVVAAFDLAQPVLLASAGELSAEVPGPASMREQIAKDGRLAIEPMFRMDAGTFKGAMANLGASGIDFEDGDQHPLHRILTALAGLGEIDPNAIVVKPFTGDRARTLRPDSGGIEIGANRNSMTTTGDDGEPSEMTIHEFTVTPGVLFPEAHAVPDSSPMVEISVPMRSKGARGEEAEATLGAVLAWLADQGRWQPVCYQVRTLDADVARNFMAAVQAGAQASRRSSDDDNDEGGN